MLQGNLFIYRSSQYKGYGTITDVIFFEHILCPQNYKAHFFNRGSKMTQQNWKWPRYVRPRILDCFLASTSNINILVLLKLHKMLQLSRNWLVFLSTDTTILIMLIFVFVFKCILMNAFTLIWYERKWDNERRM